MSKTTRKENDDAVKWVMNTLFEYIVCNSLKM